MRSDRHPYFLLRASKKPQVLEWLIRAENMTVEQVDQLNIKPDLKKAMCYVVEQKQFQQSDQKAQRLADLMMQNDQPHQQEFQIYRYQGPTTFAQTTTQTQLEIPQGIFWGLYNNQMFINHCWINLQDNWDIFSLSVFNSVGIASTINFFNSNKYELALDRLKNIL